MSSASLVSSNSLSFFEVSANLPSEIITDIFTRLPVKSLSRFKCVSKSVYALISNKKFIKQHLQKAVLKNPNLVLKFEDKLFSVDDEDWSKARRVSLPFSSALRGVEISGRSNGLLCISDQLRNKDIFLFNPTTGAFKNIPFPDSDATAAEDAFSTLGFGYHEGEDDYKVIKCVYLYDIDSYVSEARVYSLKTDEWKSIGNIPFHLVYRAAIWVGNDLLIWKATRGLEREGRYLVVSYDMSREEFMEVPQLVVSTYGEETHMEVSMLDGLISIFYLLADDEVHVWSMKEHGVKESWELRFIILRPEIAIGHIFMYLKPLIVLENGELLLEAGERARILFHPENRTYRMINPIRGAPRRFLVTPNVGSLVSPSNYHQS